MEGYSPEDRELLREMRRVRRRLKAKRLLWGLIGWAFLSAVAGCVLQYWQFTLAVAHGPGMGNTAPSGSVLLIQRQQEGNSPVQGDVILFEVSTTNDDNIDNRFYKGEKRIPDIEEDTAPLYLMFKDYANYYQKNRK